MRIDASTSEAASRNKRPPRKARLLEPGGLCPGHNGSWARYLSEAALWWRSKQFVAHAAS